MIPEDKAVELVGKYKGLVYPYMGSGMLTNEQDDNVILSNAKICALIAVDEITAEIYQLTPVYNFDKAHNYWETVKSEINKL